MGKQIQIDTQEKIDAATKQLVEIFIQQVISKKNGVLNMEIDNKYAKSNK